MNLKLDPKKAASLLSEMIGVSADSPTNSMLSWDAQTSPESSVREPDALSPIGGDEVFFTYLIPGATFRAHDGSEWNVLFYHGTGHVEIENRWLPRQFAQVSVADIRRSIHSWIEPVLVRVPDPIKGLKY